MHIYIYIYIYIYICFWGNVSGKEPACHYGRCKRYGFNPWVGKIPWRRAWQHTLVFLLGESHGQRSLVGYYSPWGRKESDTIEWLTQARSSLWHLEALHKIIMSLSFKPVCWVGSSATYSRAFLVALTVKNPPAMQETQVWSLSWEDSLKKGMATHSSIPAWKILCTEELGIAKNQTLLKQLSTHTARPIMTDIFPL